MELFYLHDWNVVDVPDGLDFQQIVAAQRLRRRSATGQPTAIVYRTVKGWQYGIEGKGLHGAGHKLCSDGFYDALGELHGAHARACCRRCEAARPALRGGPDGPAVMEECFWEALAARAQARSRTSRPTAEALAGAAARPPASGSTPRGARPRAGAPARRGRLRARASARRARSRPSSRCAPGSVDHAARRARPRAAATQPGVAAGRCSSAAADLLGSTSVNADRRRLPARASGTPPRNPAVAHCSRSAASARTPWPGSSPASRASGTTSASARPTARSWRRSATSPRACTPSAARRGAPSPATRTSRSSWSARTPGSRPARTAPRTPTRRPLQLLQENFPRGTAITLTPWDPQEIWPLMAAALARRPALIAPFVTRPNEPVLDRERPRPRAGRRRRRSGVYRLRAPRRTGDGTRRAAGERASPTPSSSEALPLLRAATASTLDVYYVASAELFDLLPRRAASAIFPEARAQRGDGHHRLHAADDVPLGPLRPGPRATLHPFAKGHFLGSGPGPRCSRRPGSTARARRRRSVAISRPGPRPQSGTCSTMS